MAKFFSKHEYRIFILLFFSTIELFATENVEKDIWQYFDTVTFYYLPFNVYTYVPVDPSNLIFNDYYDSEIIYSCPFENSDSNYLKQFVEKLEKYIPIKTTQRIDFQTATTYQDKVYPSDVNTRLLMVLSKGSENFYIIGIGLSIQYFSFNNAVYELDEDVIQMFGHILCEYNLINVRKDIDAYYIKILASF